VLARRKHSGTALGFADIHKSAASWSCCAPRRFQRVICHRLRGVGVTEQFRA
jgi:hypothetical protein